MVSTPGWVVRCRTWAELPRFQSFILGVILLNAVLVGLETDTRLRAEFATAFNIANQLILCIFVLELAIRLGADRLRVGTFLRDGWNAFDALVIAVSLLPGVGAFATIARI